MTIKSIGVIGAGIMGNGIAQVCATHGLEVTMIDINDAALERGMDTITRSLERMVKKGTLSQDNLGTKANRSEY